MKWNEKLNLKLKLNFFYLFSYLFDSTNEKFQFLPTNQTKQNVWFSVCLSVCLMPMTFLNYKLDSLTTVYISTYIKSKLFGQTKFWTQNCAYNEFASFIISAHTLHAFAWQQTKFALNSGIVCQFLCVCPPKMR